METIFMRFSLISDQIFEQLDAQSLVECKKVSRSWKKTVEDCEHERKHLIVYIFKGTKKCIWPTENNDWWKDMNRTPFNILKQYAEDIRRYKRKIRKYQRLIRNYENV